MSHSYRTVHDDFLFAAARTPPEGEVSALHAILGEAAIVFALKKSLV